MRYYVTAGMVRRFGCRQRRRGPRNAPRGREHTTTSRSLHSSAHVSLQATLEPLRLQGQVSGAIGSLSLAPSLPSPAPSGGGAHVLAQQPDSSALQALSRGIPQQSALLPSAAALSTLARLLARLASSGGLAGLTAAAAAGQEAPPQPTFAGHAAHRAREAGVGDERTATNVPDARPGIPQARYGPAAAGTPSGLAFVLPGWMLRNKRQYRSLRCCRPSTTRQSCCVALKVAQTTGAGRVMDLSLARAF